MTPESQRIAIAEAMGLSVVKDEYEALGKGNPKRDVFMPSAIDAFRRRWPSGVYPMPVPDYLNDLNAIHEAEKTLTDHTGYVMSLKLVTGEHLAPFFLIHATAAQKSEAFLRATGRWVES